MTDRLQELAVFIRAAESGSFSQAGRDLALSQPSVSRIINALEARLGTALMLRSTRRITLTDAGALFLERARDVLADLEDAEDAARGVDSLRGTIRLAIPVVYGTRVIIPWLSEFLRLHPLLKVEMTVSDARQDLVAEGADVAIRLGELEDSAYGARKLAILERTLVAAPDYLKARGVPKSPADLKHHDCIFGPGGFGRTRWVFRQGQRKVEVEVQGRIHTDSGPGVFASALAGLGIAMASTVMFGAEIAEGKLVTLLPEYSLEPVPVHAVFPAGQRPSMKVRALVDYLSSTIREAGQR
jgi:DNA-binding transcriptional LysR family regulator